MKTITGLIKSMLEYLSLRLLRRIEIRYRLISSFILLSLFPLLISGYISYVESSNEIEEKTRVFSIEVVKQVSKNVQLLMSQIDAESEGLALSDRVQHAMTDADAGNEMLQSAARQDMTKILLDHYGAFDYINQKYILDKNNKIIDTQVFAQLTQGVVRFVEKSPDLHGRPHWGSYDNGAGQQSIGMLRAIISKSSNKLIGNLFLLIRPEHFSVIFDDIDLGRGTNIFILDAGSGKVIVWPHGKQYSPTNIAVEPALIESVTDSMLRHQQNNSVEFVGKGQDKYLASYTHIPNTTWFVASTIQVDKLTTGAQSLRNKIVLIGLLCFLFSIAFAYIISRSISAPLKELVNKMFETGNYANRLPAAEEGGEQEGQDELGRLGQSFARMNDAVNQKIQQINEINASLEKKVSERTAALVSSEQESRTLIENSPDTIARYNRDCRRIYVNPAFGALTDGGVAALLGTTPSECPGGPNAEIYEAKIKEVFATGNNSYFELKWPGKDGKELCSHIRLTAERDLSGGVTSVLGVGRDITELNESRAELKRKELAKSRFLAAAGHDLRQPLAAANLFIDALKYTGPSAGQNQIIQRLDQTMSTFNGLLDALLNISKLDAGIIKPEYTSINVIDIINWLEQSFAPMASEKKLGFKLHFSMKESLLIRSDINLLKSVLMNLVSNAIKYTSKGAILVSARRRGSNVLFQVWDTGIGITDEYIEQIFDEFYQINNPQRDRSSGLGLGLAIAKRAISLLDAKIICRSQVGRGSVFEFCLPLSDTPSGSLLHTTTAAPRDEEANASFAKGKRFIVLEDDALVAHAMTGLLEIMGGEVNHFHNAEEALRHNNIEHADYYIVDYMLSGASNGAQFLNMISEKRGESINAVLLTGDTSPSFIREMSACDWPVLHKPVSISKLLTSLRTQGRSTTP